MKQCVAMPWRVHHGGGIIVNPEFNNGTEGWKVYGGGEIKLGWLKQGNDTNTFIVAHKRTQPRDSLYQLVHLQYEKLYSFSGMCRSFFRYSSCFSDLNSLNVPLVH